MRRMADAMIAQQTAKADTDLAIMEWAAANHPDPGLRGAV